MRRYNFKKAKELIDYHKDTLKTARLGMYEDWFWTAEKVWSKGKYEVDLVESPEIAGIKSSAWATPTLELTFKNKTVRMIPCFTGKRTKCGPRLGLLGVLSSPVQDRLPPLEAGELNE